MGYFDNYSFRCSSLGNIVSKSGKQTAEVKSFLYDIFIQEIYGVKKVVNSKYFDKGKFCEEDGISMLQKVFYKNHLLVKNKERKNNGFINGECDIDMPDAITDIKNAWDLTTLFKADLTHEYRIQLIGYCWLWNKNKARLFYTLNTMPHFMIDDEKTKLFYSNKYEYVNVESDKYLQDCDILAKSLNFDNLSLEDRFRFWEFEVTENDINIIKDAVIKARETLNIMYDNHQEMMIKNKNIL